MAPAIPLLVNFSVGAALLAGAAGYRHVGLLSRHAEALAVFPLVSAAAVTVYVFGEDTYRGNGISRWDAYRSPGGALGPMLVLSLVLMAACAVLFLYAGLRGRDRLVPLTALGGGLTCLVLLTPTIIGFSLN